MPFKIWIGKRESDILTYPYYDASITFWGSNKGSNVSFCITERIHENYGNDFLAFIYKAIKVHIKNCDGKIQLHFYNNALAYKMIYFYPELKKYVVNLNKLRIFDTLRHKTLSRVWLQNTADVPAFSCLSLKECGYTSLKKRFPAHNRFVIQKNFSGGGEGTFLLDNENYHSILSKLPNDEIFLVSPYYENNQSLSCHLIIDSKKATVFPVTRQLLNYKANNIAYNGSIGMNNMSEISIQVKRTAQLVGNRLLEIEYRGICGLDFIFTKNRIMLIEINPRYQGSSYIINAELKRLKLPSLFELNTMAFTGELSNYVALQIKEMQLPYESHVVTGNNPLSASHINYPTEASLFLDGLEHVKTCENNVYLYKYLIHHK